MGKLFLTYISADYVLRTRFVYIAVYIFHRVAFNILIKHSTFDKIVLNEI